MCRSRAGSRETHFFTSRPTEGALRRATHLLPARAQSPGDGGDRDTGSRWEVCQGCGVSTSPDLG